MSLWPVALLWVGAMILAMEWVFHCGAGAVESVKRMGAQGGDCVSPNTVKCLNAIHHPDDHLER